MDEFSANTTDSLLYFSFDYDDPVLGKIKGKQLNLTYDGYEAVSQIHFNVFIFFAFNCPAGYFFDYGYT